ncbi:GDSL-type esterase/lipase family protein [Asticcacaulis sp. ZE23SCel15]|uniref:SGNH/GDSL hydrolase family protein n=1 Tax=Asticcacaulis sp. ZE23SCel15 TaxID=3059027 RepID=UPI00265DC4D2|nr:GDSL-type esterase/lipase family protein [Asticcacaulis sp. ZE23SCel15]WKL57227.1 GDSL-type esterase/lipase family protein [Asticcacaulis sp. ZE23SCel15]
MRKDFNAKLIARNIVLAVGAFTIVSGIAGFAGSEYQKSLPKPPPPVDHFKQRVKAVVSQAGQMPNDTLIIGDSLTEFARLDTLCGGTVLNAGISSATIQDTARWSNDLIAAAKPKRIVFALGTNNAKQSETVTPVAVVMAAYATMIDQAKGHDLYIATLPAISPDREGFNAAHIAKLNDSIRALAAQKGIALIDLDRQLPMTDGVHLTPEGYTFWRKQMNTACPA